MARLNLLSVNAKLLKHPGVAAPYRVVGLQLAPARFSGHQVCPHATPSCVGACVGYFSGRRVTASVRAAAVRKARLYFENRAEFLEQLHADIDRHAADCRRAGLLPLVRLNAFSDLEWSPVIREHPGCTFYDYTKSRERMRDYLRGRLPENYHVTFSANERVHPATLRAFLDSGGNVAQVFTVDYYPQAGRIGPLPRRWRYWGRDYRVIDGDQHDVRLPETDGRGVVVGLRLKGTNKAKASGRRGLSVEV